MRKIILFLIILSLTTNLVHAANYGAEEYGCGLFGIGCSATPTTPPSGGGGRGTTTITYECSQDSDCKLNQYCFEHKCYDIECFDNNDCKEDESCWNHKCVKWFDMEILEFESPVKVGEFFDFTYFLKAVAEINGDVEIKFWIEQDGNIVTSGQDTIYFSSFEEKTKTKKLFLPDDISSGTYIFYIEVTYGAYTASAHRTIGIEVKDGMAEIKISPDFTQYIIYGLIGLGIFIVFLIFYLERRKIKKGIINEERWIKKHKFSILIFILFVILGILAYYFKWYESIANWIPKVILWSKINILPYFDSYGYYILGGITVFIFIIGLIVLIKKKYKKKIKTKRKLKRKKRKIKKKKVKKKVKRKPKRKKKIK